MNNIEKLKKWFDALSDEDKKEVITFLYGEALLLDGVYLGPRTDYTTEGLYLGLRVKVSKDTCPRCGKPW